MGIADGLVKLDSGRQFHKSILSIRIAILSILGSGEAWEGRASTPHQRSTVPKVSISCLLMQCWDCHR